MPCTGNQTENCGGSNRLTPFRYYTGVGSTASSTAIVRSISSAALIATGLPRGFEYKRFYVDGPGSCILNFQQPDDQSMTVASCATRCTAAGYETAGMEYSYQCFCDNVVRMGGTRASSESECSTKCAGNIEETCGGPCRLSIWSNQTTLKVIQAPKPMENVSDWVIKVASPMERKAQGCSRGS